MMHGQKNIKLHQVVIVGFMLSLYPSKR